jgi:colicin import membrane protein
MYLNHLPSPPSMQELELELRSARLDLKQAEQQHRAALETEALAARDAREAAESASKAVVEQAERSIAAAQHEAAEQAAAAAAAAAGATAEAERKAAAEAARMAERVVAMEAELATACLQAQARHEQLSKVCTPSASCQGGLGGWTSPHIELRRCPKAKHAQKLCRADCLAAMFAVCMPQVEVEVQALRDAAETSAAELQSLRERLAARQAEVDAARQEEAKSRLLSEELAAALSIATQAAAVCEWRAADA